MIRVVSVMGRDLSHSYFELGGQDGKPSASRRSSRLALSLSQSTRTLALGVCLSAVSSTLIDVCLSPFVASSRCITYLRFCFHVSLRGPGEPGNRLASVPLLLLLLCVLVR